MVGRFMVRSIHGLLMVLLCPAVLLASDNAFYRAQLNPAGTQSSATAAVPTMVDVKVHAARDAAGKVVRGYVDFDVDGPLSGSTAVTDLSITVTTAAGDAVISVPAWRLPQTLSDRLSFHNSAPVSSNDPRGLETLTSLLDSMAAFSVKLTTSQTTLHGVAQSGAKVAARQLPESGPWREVDEAALPLTLQDSIPPARFYRTFQLDGNAFQAVLHTAPGRSSAAEKPVISLPMPDGQLARFSIEESPVMEPALAAQFPQFKTYRGAGLDNPATTMRFDVTNGRVHAIIRMPQDTVYINPIAAADKNYYASYYARDLTANQNRHSFRPDTVPSGLDQRVQHLIGHAVTSPPVGATLRTYRLALATTKGFTADPTYGGGSDGVAARNATLMNLGQIVNMVNALYEPEVAVHFNLIANELNAVFDTTSNPDPGYTDGDENAMLGQNQQFLDAAVGNASYDIGHVLGLAPNPGSAAGVATVGVVCSSPNKAAAATVMGIAKTVPTALNVDVQVLDHEMAHQFNANHTTNSTSMFCAVERNGPTAYEAGSGSTILANAGSCAPENLQMNTDVYFHGNTLDEINAYIGAGGACFAPVATNNNPPTVTAGPNVTVPMGTPFTLTATPGPSNGNNLTFAWEEFDIGTASPPQSDDGTRPLFRTLAPSTSPSRSFPAMTYVLNNANQPPATITCDDGSMGCIPGEILPVTNRTMNFRVTIRDNHAGGGGSNNASLQVTTTTTAGPFQVTQPNTAVTWQTGSIQTVTWNVANTTAAPVNVANVNILLSTDGGVTFPVMLAQNVPNNGSATITVPNSPTATARIEVQAVGNIFFDVSDVNFTIAAPGIAAVTVNMATVPAGAPAPMARSNAKQSLAHATVDRNVVDLGFSMDGQPYSDTVTLMFPLGSTHIMSTFASQTAPGMMSQFDHWSDGGALTHDITALPNSVFTAFFDVQFQLMTGVTPAVGGSVTPASGQYYPSGSTVNVSAAPNPGYLFSYWIGIPPPGQYYDEEQPVPQSPNQAILMNAPKNLMAVFTEGPTALAGVIASKTGTPDARVWNIQLNNSGPGAADTAAISGFDLSQTFGAACSPLVITPLPAVAGNLAPGGSGSVPVTIDFTGCPANARFIANIAFTANSGKATGSIVRNNQFQ